MTDPSIGATSPDPLSPPTAPPMQFPDAEGAIADLQLQDATVRHLLAVLDEAGRTVIEGAPDGLEGDTFGGTHQGERMARHTAGARERVLVTLDRAAEALARHRPPARRRDGALMAAGANQARLVGLVERAHPGRIERHAQEWQRCAAILEQAASSIEAAAAQHTEIGGRTGPAMAQACSPPRSCTRSPTTCGAAARPCATSPTRPTRTRRSGGGSTATTPTTAATRPSSSARTAPAGHPDRDPPRPPRLGRPRVGPPRRRRPRDAAGPSRPAHRRCARARRPRRRRPGRRSRPRSAGGASGSGASAPGVGALVAGGTAAAARATTTSARPAATASAGAAAGVPRRRRRRRADDARGPRPRGRRTAAVRGHHDVRAAADVGRRPRRRPGRAAERQRLLAALRTPLLRRLHDRRHRPHPGGASAPSTTSARRSR